MRLEGEAAFDGRLTFRGDRLRLVVNDRLDAPNEERSFDELRPELDGLLRELYDGTRYELTRDPEPRRRLTVAIDASTPVDARTLLTRLGT